ncbi:MAG: ornithine cyclodeaminase family protein [Actinomycetota bacterium]|nr:ornithine cyclodeaminase family protein [Actinomycetota bacterium]
MSGLPWLDAERIAALMSMRDAVDVIETALVAGLDTSADPARVVVPVAHGQLLLMPSQSLDAVGVKLASVAPGNAALGLPRIQAVYVLFDPVRLTPIALLDGVALTSLRTPAMSAVAVRHLAPAGAGRLVVFGSGPQAAGHVEAVRAVRDVRDVVIVGRDQDRAAALASAVGGRVGSVADVARADIVVCATSASEALFDGALVGDGACVIAVGSHEPHVRELDEALMHRANVVVEDVGAALREAGDVILAGLGADRLTPISDVVNGRVAFADHAPRVFKSVGMAWQDLAVAAEIVRRA